MRPTAAVLALTIVASAASARSEDQPFSIRVVDDRTGRGVPLVELETTNAVRYVTDSAGYVALDEPTLFGRKVFFTVKSHGYEFPKDGFGYPGKAFDVKPGGEATLSIKRINIAERLYRVTGGDIYRDSVRLGKGSPIEKPLLNAQVFGSDSVVNAVYGGKLHWFWGDTLRPSYPLGLFDVPGAVSALPADGGLKPEAGVNLTYFEGSDGFVRATADMPGDGPTWIFGLAVVPDGAGRERMLTPYMKIKPPLDVYARGIAEWDDAANAFRKLTDIPLDAPALPGGQTFKHAEDGVEHVYFATPYPFVRARATVDGFTKIEAYEAYTCLVEGSRLDDPKLDRAADGTLRYSWKRDTPAVGVAEQKKLVEAGLMKHEEGRASLRDRDTGKPVLAHTGSVSWNEYRKRWVMVFGESFGGPSFLGEIWYAEADAPEGPWVHATKIATHDKYDFYNPKQHPYFDEDGGRTIYFEGTYTNTFSGNPVKTPRYEYNQMMYRLDLSDERLGTPVAIYRGDGAAPFVDATAGILRDGKRGP